MTPTSPRAFLFSATLHGGIALALLLFTVWENRTVEQPKVFELVAGPGNNYAATAAPEGTGIMAPKLPATPKSPPKAQPEPEPVAETTPIAPAPVAPAPKVATPPPTKPTQAPPNFKNTITRQVVRAEAKAKAEIKKERETAAKITKEQFDRENKAKAASATKAAASATKIAKIDTDSIRDGVVGGSKDVKEGAGGKALTREEARLIDLYFARLKLALKENHEKPSGLSDTLTARIAFYVAADGSVSRAHIVKSSGSSEFDRSVLEALKRLDGIGPRPDGKSDTVELDFKMRDEETG